MGCSALNYDDEVKWEDDDEDEALSFSDLPVKLIKEGNKNQTKNEEDGDEDFNFGSLGSTEQEMCVADQVFFQGQILPLRLSVSSDSGLNWCRHDSLLNTSRLLSRSESMDHGSLSRFTSVSGRSSSFNSISNPSSSYYKTKPMKTRNNFNTHPRSPKPNIRLSNSRPVNVNSRIQRSSMWEFFRLSLVRAPELELKDLKARSNNNNNSGNKNSVSRNSSCSSSNTNSSSSSKNSTTKIVNKSGEAVAKGFLGKRLGSFSGCKCSVNAVETFPLNNAAMEDKKKKKLVQDLKVKNKMKEKQEGKQALSRNRTFEWLTELSHRSYVDVALKIDS